MIELKPCPFCGGTDLIHYGDYIDCRSCDASGPWSTDKATAAELWNKRTEGETMPVIEANNYRYKDGKIERWSDDEQAWVTPMTVLREKTEALIAAAIAATRAEPIEVRYRWEKELGAGDQSFLFVGSQSQAMCLFHERAYRVKRAKENLEAQLGREVVMVEEGA